VKKCVINHIVFVSIPDYRAKVKNCPIYIIEIYVHIFQFRILFFRMHHVNITYIYICMYVCMLLLLVFYSREGTLKEIN